MRRRDFPVGDEAGSRLETYARKVLGLPRPVAIRAIRKGWIRVDGRRARPDRRLEAGEVVRVTNDGLPLAPVSPGAHPTDPGDAEAERARQSVRHDEHGAVVSAKPAGEVVHAGSGHRRGWVDLLAAAVGGPLVPVGRLDRDTSGLLVVARGRGPARRLFAALRAGTLRRGYVALAHGSLPDDAGVVDQPLAKRRSRGGQERMVVDPDGARAVTRYRVLRRLRGATLVSVELETGRTHQIRAHLAHLGHPLLGDPRYGTSAARRRAAELGLARLFLHARTLWLPRPGDDPLRLDEPLPEELAATIRALE